MLQFASSPFRVQSNLPRLEAVALLLEGIGVVVVSEALPEAGAVVGGELDAAQPLRALPEVLARDHEPERPAVLARERFAVGVGREERERIPEERDGYVRGVARLRVRDDVARGRERLD